MYNTRLNIDFDKVERNIKFLSKGKEYCLMVKGNCYGLGKEAIIELVNRGHNFFGVSTFEEAIELRAISKNIRILVVVPVDEKYFQEAIEKKIEITITQLKQLGEIFPQNIFHIKFDTGMGRIGFSVEEVKEVKKIIKTKGITPVGIFSHFPSAHDESFTLKQIEKFEEILNQFEEGTFKNVHLQNSLGSIRYNIKSTNLMRLGIGIWGYLSNLEEKEKFGSELEESLSLYSRVIQEKDWDGKIGYSLTDDVNGRIATVGIGYHDFMPPSLQGFKFKNGDEIVGKICMCQTMLKVNVSECEKEIFGKNTSIYDIAKHCDVTVYYLLSKIANRIKKEMV